MTPKLWQIAMREYTYNFRRPMYLFTAFILPLIVIVIMFIVFTVLGESENDLSKFKQVGYVDLTSEQFLAHLESPPSRFVAYEDETVARLALDEDSIGAYVVIGEDYLTTGTINVYSAESIPIALHEKIEEFLLQGLTTLAPLDKPVERLKEPFRVDLFRTLNDDGEYTDPNDLVARFIVPIIFATFLFISMNTTSQFLMSGVVEEKENRMMEILVTSCKPSELLWGKVIGLGAISLTQVAAWSMGMIVVAYVRADIGEFIGHAAIGVEDILLYVGLFFLSYFVFAGVAMGIGASSTAEQEARQFAGVFSLITIFPMFFITSFLSKGKPLAIALSLFPLTSPLSILMASAFGTLETWVLVLSLIILVISVFGIMWMSIQVFRMGMLMYGQRLGLRQITRLLLKG